MNVIPLALRTQMMDQKVNSAVYVKVNKLVEREEATSFSTYPASLESVSKVKCSMLRNS